MSLRQLQTRSFLNFMVASYLSSGKKPTDTELNQALGYYFSQQPAGSPIALKPDLFRRKTKSDVDDLNDFLASVQMNLDLLFEQADEHLKENLLLTTALMTQMDALKTKRKKLSSKIDDILISAYNTDGFFSSISDNFFSNERVDFSFTSAFLDIDSGSITLPSNADQTRLLDIGTFNTPNVRVYDRKNNLVEIPYTQESDFGAAIDGLTNTAWYIKIKRSSPSEGVLVVMEIDLGTVVDPIDITKISLTPHGIKPVQCSIEKIISEDEQKSSTEPFSYKIKTSADKMIFANETEDNGITRLIFKMSKPTADYTEINVDGSRSDVYIIGIKELMVLAEFYDLKAEFVSQPLLLSEFLSGDQTIDKVALTVDQSKPVNTDIDFFIAEDVPGAVNLPDFNWQEIRPINSSVGNSKDKTLIDFGGAEARSLTYRSRPISDSDLQLKPINSSTSDVQFQNPSQSMFEEFSVYRIGEFQEEFLTKTIFLEEGINTTKILHTDKSDQNIDDTFEFWKAKLDNPNSYASSYGEIDSGNGFFYGADVGENDRSVYVETYVYSDIDLPVVLEDIVKSNPNSKLWDVKAFLNGREVANMPVGTDSVRAPLKINKGQNNFVLAINIPPSNLVSLAPYIGSIEFNLAKYGTIKLGNLNYVDHYKFSDNGYRPADNISSNKWFTIHNNEIVTRSKITDNYKLNFHSSTGSGPQALRLRADLRRTSNNGKSTPILDSYRIKFSYSPREEDS